MTTVMERSIVVAKPARAMTMNDRTHWSTHRQLTKSWREAAFWWAKQHRLSCRKATGQVCLLVEFGVAPRYINTRRDPHNWAPTIKAIADGFTDALVWIDDDSAHVRIVDPGFVVDIAPEDVRILLSWEEL